MAYFAGLVFIFFTGCILGWTDELFFRRFAHKKWINPGFLAGPCLPLYGTGLTALFLMCSVDYSFIASPAWRAVFVIFILTVLMTLVEYITGLIFTKFMHVKLWDYSDRRGNIQGIICPLFTFFWCVICAVYYLFVHSALTVAFEYMGAHPAWWFLFGAMAGVFIVDVFYSFGVVAKIRKFAKEREIVVKIEEFKLSVKNRAEKLKQRVGFVLPLKTKKGIRDELENYADGKDGE